MHIWFKIIGLLTAMLLTRGVAVAQIPVEVFAGDKKATIDVMFFKFFKNKSGPNSRFLFFNRNRASADYKMTSTAYLPQFGFTEAISYNHEKWKGFAPVLVVQLFNQGIYSKAGIQFARIKSQLTLFSWVVSETKNTPNIDLFFLGRYTPKLTEKLNLFCQLELLNSAPTSHQNNFSFTQRLRFGLKLKEFQLGLGTDISQMGTSNFTVNHNNGVFLRYEY